MHPNPSSTGKVPADKVKIQGGDAIIRKGVSQCTRRDCCQAITTWWA